MDKIVLYECPSCRKSFDKDGFTTNRYRSQERSSYCKNCDRLYKRKWHLMSNFGITPDDYNKMLDEQDGRCAICRRLPGKINLSVDHDHDTGKVRGLLCPPCNRSTEWMIYNSNRAIEYLESSGTVWQR